VPPEGGMILATGSDKSALQERLERAPPITSGAATAEIVELKVSFTDPRVGFLMPAAI